MTTANTVFAGGAKNNTPEIVEASASVAFLPGAVLVETAGEFALAGAAETGRVYVAEIPILGDTTTASVVGETTQAYSPASGEYYNVILASGQNISKDEAVKTNASGQVISQGGTGTVFGYADEAIVTTGTTARLRVRIA